MSLIELNCFDDKRDKKQEPVDIHFENVSYTAVIRDFRFWKSEKKEILKNVNGDFQSHKLTGIIGPSGSGKSTLLDIISGYRLRGVSGYVYVNGKQRNIKSLIRQSCYIMQDDKLQPLITVEEAMTFVSNVKLEVTMSKTQKKIIVNDILENFSLTESKKTLIENLSGGERKRLAVALELISNPPVLFLDEPTSGLDSKSAKQCLQILKKLAVEGRTVICSIHQPSSLLLNMFNNIYLLSNGCCIYQGAVNNLIPYLNMQNFICPTYYNPVEFVVELCVLGSESYTNTLVDAINNGKSQEWLDSPACWSNIPLDTNTINIRNLQRNEIENDFHYATSFGYQLYYLLLRTLIVSSRNQFLTRMKLIINIVTGIVLGLFFRNIGDDAGQIIVNFNLMFFCILFVMFNALTSKIITFPNDLPVIKREYFNRWYSLRAYYISTFFGDMPVQAICVIASTSLIYVLSGQPLEFFRITQFLLIIVLIGLTFQDYGILVGTLWNIENGLIFGLFTISPWVMFSGFFLYYRDAAPFFQWIYKISVFRHALEGVSISVFGYERKKLNCYKVYCHFRYPDMFLKHVDIDSNSYPINLTFILCFYVLVKICCYLAIKYKFRS